MPEESDLQLMPAVVRGDLLNGFYVSMIFLGMLFVVFSLVCLFLDKKKVFEFFKSFENKKKELVEIINDAEQMIEELNKFSDYIVNQIDLKNEQLNKSLKDTEAKIHQLSEKAAAIGGSASVSIDTTAINVKRQKAHAGLRALVSQPPIRKVNSKNEMDDSVSNTQETGTKDKVVPFHSKYSEVLRLYREGMGNLDIAKSLNIGKGEVELIVGLRR
jgi:regulator of replication initiation timing